MTNLLKLPLSRAHNLANRFMMGKFVVVFVFLGNCIVTEKGFLCQIDRGW